MVPGKRLLQVELGNFDQNPIQLCICINYAPDDVVSIVGSRYLVPESIYVGINLSGSFL